MHRRDPEYIPNQSRPLPRGTHLGTEPERRRNPVLSDCAIALCLHSVPLHESLAALPLRINPYRVVPYSRADCSVAARRAWPPLIGPPAKWPARPSRRPVISCVVVLRPANPQPTTPNSKHRRSVNVAGFSPNPSCRCRQRRWCSRPSLPLTRPKRDVSLSSHTR
jgi:hypothetical protein